jgi:hypothetical protein
MYAAIVHVVALPWARSLSNETYKLSVRFIISEVNCELKPAKWFNPWMLKTKKILSYRICYLRQVPQSTLRSKFHIQG